MPFGYESVMLITELRSSVYINIIIIVTIGISRSSGASYSGGPELDYFGEYQQALL
jgi:hypothetical protein